MDNFIEDLDKIYQENRKENKIKRENKNFIWNIPLKIDLYGKMNQNYMIRKGWFTRFLYIKDNCRVYFTDADILTMLLQLKNKTTMNLLIENLSKAYKGCFMKYDMWIAKKKYELAGMTQIRDKQILTNPQDIDISFDELFILINLILSKDQASTPLWPNKSNFLKHTTSKYISLIKYYYYKDEAAKNHLLDIGYDVKKSIYSNYNTQAKRNEKRKIFNDFDKFEEQKIL